jgi:hypothetical protein
MEQPICQNCNLRKTWPELKQKFVGDVLYIICKEECTIKKPIIQPPLISMEELFKREFNLEFSDLIKNPQQYRDATTWYHHPNDTTTVYGWRWSRKAWDTREYDLTFINGHGRA